MIPAATDSTIGAHFTVVDIVPLRVEIGKKFWAKVHRFNGEWFVLPRQLATVDTFFLYRINSYGTDTVMLPTSDHPTFEGEIGTVSDFIIDDRYIVVLYWNALLVYDRTATGVKPVRVVPLRVGTYYDRVHKIGNGYYLTSMSIDDKRRNKTWVCRVDVENAKILWERPFPDANGIEFTMFVPRRSLELGHNEVIIADLDRYRIMIYDYAGHALDSLARTIPSWTIDTSYRRHSPDRNQEYNPMDSLRRYAYDRPNIRTITLLDSATLLVTVEYPERHRRGMLRKGYVTRHDVWRRVNGAWRLDVADAEEFNPVSGDRWDDHRMLPLGIEYFRAEEGVLYQIEPYSGLSFEGKTYATIQHELDSILLENEPQYGIVVYTEKK